MTDTLVDNDIARSAHSLDDRRVNRRDRAGESRNTPGRREACDVDVLLDREGNAVQRPERRTCGNLAVRFSRVASRLFSECLHNGVETRIDSLDAAQMCFDDLNAGKVFSRNSPGQLASGQSPEFGHAFLPSSRAFRQPA